MDPLWISARWLGILALSAGSSWIGERTYFHPRYGLRSRLARHVVALDRRLAFLRAPLGARVVVAMQGAWFLLAALVAVYWSLSIGALIWPLPFVVGPLVSARLNERLSQLDAQLESWLLALSGALASNASLGQALEETTALIQSPLRDEVSLAAREVGVGVSVSDALERMAQRVGSAPLSAAVAAIRIGQRTGGGLAQTLQRSAETLREMARLEGVVRTRTAEGRAQATVVALIPIPMVGLFHHLNPGLMEPLWKHPDGPSVIVVAALLWLGAILVARKILDVDI